MSSPWPETHPLDLVGEGTAESTVTDPDVPRHRWAATYRQGGWPASVDGDALTAELTQPLSSPHRPDRHVYHI